MNYSLFFRLPLLACSFLIFVVSIAQNSETIESQNLSDQFDLLIQNSETYDNYKVIKQDKLNAFRSTMIDSLRSFTISSQEAKTKIESQNTNIEKLNSIINEKEILMAENEKERNGISVLGIQLDKT
ncbi:MAG: hypothetical protein OEX22_05815, partial [Cyclobacteriaceae bacterium]|nr:hypothetical protein [Cyclobacteriaceae bacterium]